MDNPDISFVVVKGVKPSFQKGYIFSNRSILFNGDLAFADRKAQDYFIEKKKPVSVWEVGYSKKHHAITKLILITAFT